MDGYACQVAEHTKAGVQEGPAGRGGEVMIIARGWIEKFSGVQTSLIDRLWSGTGGLDLMELVSAGSYRASGSLGKQFVKSLFSWSSPIRLVVLVIWGT